MPGVAARAPAWSRQRRHRAERQRSGFPPGDLHTHLPPHHRMPPTISAVFSAACTGFTTEHPISVCRCRVTSGRNAMLMQPSTRMSAPSSSRQARPAATMRSNASGRCRARSKTEQPTPRTEANRSARPERPQPRGDPACPAARRREDGESGAELCRQMHRRGTGADHRDRRALAQRIEPGIAETADDHRIEARLLPLRRQAAAAPARRGPRPPRPRSPPAHPRWATFEFRSPVPPSPSTRRVAVPPPLRRACGPSGW